WMSELISPITAFASSFTETLTTNGPIWLSPATAQSPMNAAAAAGVRAAAGAAAAGAASGAARAVADAIAIANTVAQRVAATVRDIGTILRAAGDSRSGREWAEYTRCLWKGSNGRVHAPRCRPRTTPD